MRNYRCPNYATCLDIAALGNEVFTCIGCPDEKAWMPDTYSDVDIESYWRLLGMIFHGVDFNDLEIS